MLKVKGARNGYLSNGCATSRLRALEIACATLLTVQLILNKICTYLLYNLPAIHTYLAKNMHGQPRPQAFPGSAANQAAATGHYVERRVSVAAPVLAPQALRIRGGDSRADDL